MFGSNSQGQRSSVAVLPVTDMVEVAEVFQGAYSHVMANLVGEQKARVTAFVAGYVLTEKPYLLVTPEGLDRAISAVFGNEHVRDFVFTLHFTFGSRWGAALERWQSLCANLALAAVPHSRVKLSAVPDALADRLATSPDEAYNLLVANQWLVVLMLLQLFISLSPQKALQ